MKANHNRLLVLDDEHGICEFVGEVAERLGFEVFTAENGADALALIEGGFSPGLIVSDWQMPQMDGIAVDGIDFIC